MKKMKSLWNGKLEKIDLSNYVPGDTNRFYLDWFELLRYRKDKIVIYGTGQWYLHLMDWRGCNFFHGRLPKSPVFNFTDEALEWLKFQVQNGNYKDKFEMSGHHGCGRECNKCRDRILNDWVSSSCLLKKENKE
jgi:hypothetical protein